MGESPTWEDPGYATVSEYAFKLVYCMIYTLNAGNLTTSLTIRLAGHCTFFVPLRLLRVCIFLPLLDICIETRYQMMNQRVSMTSPLTSQVYKGDPRPHIPPCVMASSALGLKLDVFRFLPITHVKTNAKTMCLQSLHAALRFTQVLSSRSDRSRCRWHTHLTNCGYFD